MNLNSGFIYEPIIIGEDYLFGGYTKLTGEPLQSSSDWTAYMPSFEKQATPQFDTFSCVSFATTNAVEMLFKRQYGYEPNLSDRFLANISGTTKEGNTPKKVAEAWRKKGIVEEYAWPFDDSITSWEQFFAEIPQKLFTLAATWIAEYRLGYEFVSPDYQSIKAALKYSPVAASFYAWAENDGVYYRPEGARDGHYAVIIGFYPNGNFKVFDSYAPSVKEVDKATIPMFAMRYAVDRQIKNTGWFATFLAQIYALVFAAPAKPEPTPVPLTNPPAPPEPKRDLVGAVCSAIQEFEGWYPGSRSYRNCNPGNLRCGAVMNRIAIGKDPQGFCRFADVETGMKALRTMIRSAASGASKVYKPSDTLEQFFGKYAPSTDGNHPHVYAAYVAQKLGMPITTRLKELL